MRLIDYKELMEQKPTLLGCTANNKGQHIKFFEHPQGEESSVIGVINEVAFNTGFYDLSDFSMLSEYNPVLHNDGTVMCEFETN